MRFTLSVSFFQCRILCVSEISRYSRIMSGVSWAPLAVTSSGPAFPVQNGKNTRGYRSQATMGFSTQAAPVSQQYPAQSYVQNPSVPYMVLRNAPRPATPHGWYGRGNRGEVAHMVSHYGPEVGAQAMASVVPPQHQTGPWGGPFGARRRGRKTRKSKHSRSRKAKKQF